MKKIMVSVVFATICLSGFGQSKKAVVQQEKQFYVPFNDKFLGSLNTKSDSVIRIIMGSKMEAYQAQKVLDYIMSIKTMFNAYRRAEFADTVKTKGGK